MNALPEQARGSSFSRQTDLNVNRHGLTPSSEEAIREVEGSLLYFESALGLKFTGKCLHSNVRGFSKRTRKAAAIYDVRLEGEDWLRKALSRHQIRVADVVARNAQRQSI